MFVPDQLDTEHRLSVDDDYTYESDDHHDYTYDPGDYHKNDGGVPTDYDYEDDYDAGHQYNDLSNDTSCAAKHADYDYEGDQHEPHQMVVFFCDELFIDLKKCCDKNHNLNLR